MAVENETETKTAQICAVFIGKQRQYAFTPEPDITPAELASVMVFMYMAIGANMRQVPPSVLDGLFAGSLSPEVQRHFRVRENSQIVVVK